MIPEPNMVVEVCGEGKTDIGHSSDAGPPTAGVVPILMYRLCGKPKGMLVKSRRLMHLEGRTLRKKVWLAKHQAWVNGSNAVVFVIDSDAKPKALPRIRAELEDGRNGGLEEFPMAVGVAQPCIESWLLTDATAIRRGIGLSATPPSPTIRRTCLHHARTSRPSWPGSPVRGRRNSPPRKRIASPPP